MEVENLLTGAPEVDVFYSHVSGHGYNISVSLRLLGSEEFHMLGQNWKKIVIKRVVKREVISCKSGHCVGELLVNEVSVDIS